MNTPTFSRGVVVAAVFALVTTIVVTTLMPFIGIGSVLRLGIPAISLAYVLYLLRESSERTGTIVTLSLWSALAVVTWWVAPPMPFYVLIHAGAIWLVRSLYFYSGILPSLMDLGLSALAVCAFAWAAGRTGSVFLATWTYFLVQAAFVAIPPAIGRSRSRKISPDNSAFDRARRQADDALRALAGR